MKTDLHEYRKKIKYLKIIESALLLLLMSFLVFLLFLFLS